MYVSIDMKEMKVIHKHPSCNVVLNLVYLECPKSECHVSTIDMCLKDKTELELKMLYRNMIGGEKFPADLRKVVLDHIFNKVPINDVIPEEVARLASNVGTTDRKVYKYIKGQFSSFVNPSIFQNAPEAPKVHTPAPPPFFAKKPSSLDTLKEDDPLPEKEEYVQRAPREATGSSDRPKAGSTTGKVWDIADNLSNTIADDKALRKSVIAECEAQGINKSTASVQFGRWKNSR